MDGLWGQEEPAGASTDGLSLQAQTAIHCEHRWGSFPSTDGLFIAITDGLFIAITDGLLIARTDGLWD